MGERIEVSGNSASAERSESSAARAGVVLALRDLERGERDSMERLHGALCDLVRALRSSGRSCDDVVGEIRDLVAQPATPDGARKIPPIAREALVELTLRWCADEYAQGDEP